MPSIEDLEAAFEAAWAAAEEYAGEVAAKYRARFPDPAQWRDPGPDPDTAAKQATAWTDAEREHLATLRTAAREAAIAIHRARQQDEGHTSGE